MEDELVTVVQESIAVDRLVMADGEVAIEARILAGELALDGNRLNPMDDVLQL
jgi:hypothetical protein